MAPYTAAFKAWCCYIFGVRDASIAHSSSDAVVRIPMCVIDNVATAVCHAFMSPSRPLLAPASYHSFLRLSLQDGARAGEVVDAQNAGEADIEVLEAAHRQGEAVDGKSQKGEHAKEEGEGEGGGKGEEEEEYSRVRREMVEAVAMADDENR